MGQLKPESGSSSAALEKGRQENQPVGKILRQARLQFDLEIADVEAALRIRAVHLLALEEGHIDKLPGRVYAIGFARAYAEYLGLDGNQIVHLFKAQSTDTTRKAEHHFPVPASESKIPSVYVLIGSLVALVVVLAGLSVFYGAGQSSSAIPSVSTQVGQINAGQAPLEVAMLSAIETAVGTGGPAALVKPASRIVLQATESAWVEIRNAANKPILSRIMKAGDSYLVPDEEGLTLSTGNAGVISLTVDGRAVPPLGAKGDILRNVKLVADALKPAAPAAGEVPVTADGTPTLSGTADGAEEDPVTITAPVVVAPRPRAAPPEVRRPVPVIVRTPRDREGG